MSNKFLNKNEYLNNTLSNLNPIAKENILSLILNNNGKIKNEFLEKTIMEFPTAWDMLQYSILNYVAPATIAIVNTDPKETYLMNDNNNWVDFSPLIPYAVTSLSLSLIHISEPTRPY